MAELKISEITAKCCLWNLLLASFLAMSSNCLIKEPTNEKCAITELCTS